MMGATLPDLPGPGNNSAKPATARDYAVNFLRTHGPSTAREMATPERRRGRIAVLLRANPRYFVRTGEKRKFGAEVWRLREEEK
jgi:hypothetical protein